MKTCKACGTDFPITSNRGRKPDYCPACRVGSLTTCQWCNKEFARNHVGQTFCSQKCNMALMNTGVYHTDPEPWKRKRTVYSFTCLECGKEFESTTPSRKCCSRECVRKYNGRVKSELAGNVRYLKQGGRVIHRAVAEGVLGRELKTVEIVHHEDLDKHNNHPANLIVFPDNATHARHHALDHPGKGRCDCPGIRLAELL